MTALLSRRQSGHEEALRSTWTSPQAFKAHYRNAGNPFFVEELVQSLAESGKLQGRKGGCRLVGPLDTVEVPTSVPAPLAARIDRLAQRERDIPQTAAVSRREFDEPTLAGVVEQDAPQLREALQLLKDAEFVHEHAVYPVAESLFRHPLTHKVSGAEPRIPPARCARTQPGDGFCRSRAL